ncbi:MAG: ABC transporter substrate-binding protein [Elstera sp.]
MKRVSISALASVTALTLLAAGPVWADCGFTGRTGTVNVLANSFPVLDHMATAMKACNKDGLTVNVKLTSQLKEEVEQAFSSGASPFDLAQVGTGSFTTLAANGSLQPITDLVLKYKAKYDIQYPMLITIGKDVYGIAFQTNLQHLFYRKDLLEQHKIPVPKTYAEVLAAAKKLKEVGAVENPFSAAYKPGWDLANEFTNIYLSEGGKFFADGSAEPKFQSPEGLKTLATMKDLVSYMSPNALGLATGDVTTAFQQGTTALGILWATRAAAMDDAKVSKVVGKVGFAAAPAADIGAPAATTQFWDAFVMPRSMKGDRETAFLLLMEATKLETMKAAPDLANWLRPGISTSEYARGVQESVAAQAPGFPTEPYFSLALAALGQQVGDYLAGRKTAEQALSEATRAYTQSAKEKGFLK